MSRHRLVRNLDLDAEMNDGSDSENELENEWDAMTADQRVLMDSGLEHVRSLLGDVVTSDLTDKQIKDSLWYYYFDAEKTVAWMLEEKEKARKKAEKKNVLKLTKPTTASNNLASSSQPKAKAKPASKTAASSSSKPTTATTSMADDLAGMNLGDDQQEDPSASLPLPKMTMERSAILKEVMEKEKDGKGGSISLVVIGHVDAGKSTLMGRLLYELGVLSEKEKIANERGSEKMGKSSFQYAWALDGTIEERERGVTMDIALDHFSTPSRHFTLLDAPGHRDFIPNMISGAAQADAALLVVDASTGEFESGFEGGGQTREHALLVRSLGVKQVVVVVNKLDTVDWLVDRFDDIQDQMKPFLAQSGFLPSKTTFIPVGAMQGVNLVDDRGASSIPWYTGPTLVEQLDSLDVPSRALDAPLRLPVSNVFKGQTSSGVGIAGRVCSGVVQVGERLRILPGDESGIVRSIEVDDESVPWAVAGSNVTLYLAAVDPIHLSIGSVLCPQSSLVPQVTTFSAQIILFDLDVPILAGTPVELFHHSANLPANVTKLVNILDRATGAVLKSNPRVLPRNTSATVQITIRAPAEGSNDRQQKVSLETFQANKEMGRILLRRGGETVGAGIVLEVIR